VADACHLWGNVLYLQWKKQTNKNSLHSLKHKQGAPKRGELPHGVGCAATKKLYFYRTI
jgi:hypothetical protein